MILRLLLITKNYKVRAKIVYSFFVCPKELEEGTRSRPHLLVIMILIAILMRMMMMMMIIMILMIMMPMMMRRMIMGRRLIIMMMMMMMRRRIMIMILPHRGWYMAPLAQLVYLPAGV